MGGYGSKGDYNLRPGESPEERDRRNAEFETTQRAIQKIKEEEERKKRLELPPPPSPSPLRPAPPDPPGLRKIQITAVLAFLLSIIPWFFVIILDLAAGAGENKLQFVLLLVGIYIVAFIIARLFVAFWKPLLLASLIGGSYYAYRLWYAEPNPQPELKKGNPKNSKPSKVVPRKK